MSKFAWVWVAISMLLCYVWDVLFLWILSTLSFNAFDFHFLPSPPSSNGKQKTIIVWRFENFSWNFICFLNLPKYHLRLQWYRMVFSFFGRAIAVYYCLSVNSRQQIIIQKFHKMRFFSSAKYHFLTYNNKKSDEDVKRMKNSRWKYQHSGICKSGMRWKNNNQIWDFAEYFFSSQAYVACFNGNDIKLTQIYWVKCFSLSICMFEIRRAWYCCC